MDRLPDAELSIMQIVWDTSDKLFTKEILERLEQSKGIIWSVSTLQTLLNRLIARSFLGSEKQKKERYYWALIPEEEYKAFESMSFLKRVHKGSVFSLVSAISGLKPVSQDELVALEALLQSYKKE